MNLVTIDLNLPDDVEEQMKIGAAAAGVSVEAYTNKLLMQCIQTANQIPYYRVREAKEGFSMREAARALLIGIVRGLRDHAPEIVPDDADDEASAAPARPRTGAQALAYWRKNNLLGTFNDRPEDSPDLARILREKAQTREWGEP